jgi:hypothetical protein
MKTRAACLMVLLAAACCSKEASKTPDAKAAAAPAAKPAEAPAAKPAEAPAAKPAEAAANPAGAPAAPATAAVPTKLEKTTPSANYPLTTCVVSGEALGDDRVAYKWGDTEVQFCCPDCVKDFEKEPEKYLAKIRAAPK